MPGLTKSQYVELRRYEPGFPSWRPERPNSNLIRRNLLTLAPAYGPGFYRITEAGAAELAAFRTKHGLKEES